MNREIVRVGLKQSKNYNSYESTIEQEIWYETPIEREQKVAKLYARCRKDIAKQVALDVE